MIRNGGVYYAVAAVWLWIPYLVIFGVAGAELVFSIVQKDIAGEPVGT